MLPYNPNLKTAARRLRKEMTDAEQVLWARLRRKQLCQVQFYRQKPIGNFIVDFYAPRAQLVVEVDGGHHMTTDRTASDAERDAYLRGQGFRVMRFNNAEVLLNTDAVVEVIHRALEANPPSPPLLKGGEKG